MNKIYVLWLLNIITLRVWKSFHHSTSAMHIKPFAWNFSRGSIDRRPCLLWTFVCLKGVVTPKLPYNHRQTIETSVSNIATPFNIPGIFLVEGIELPSHPTTRHCVHPLYICGFYWNWMVNRYQRKSILLVG